MHQAAELAAFATSWHADRPIIVMGDFNAEPDSAEIGIIRQKLRDVFHEQGVSGEERLTFPSGPLGSREAGGRAWAIDYVFVSKDIQVRDIRVVRESSPASDHAPVIARLRVDA
jgi:endonuclease/exonuclease/phosphatase family metal-dependent hydrolase